MPEIIDLTESSPPPVAIEIFSEEELPPPASQQNRSRKRKSRKKRSRGPVTAGGVDTSAQTSRDHSQERDSNKRADGGEGSSRESCSPPPHPPDTSVEEPGVFFFDAVASTVEALQYGLEQSPEATAIHREHPAQDMNKLLLPSHVSVLPSATESLAPIEAMPPPTVDSDDDYIEYLDYEDRKGPGLIRYFETEADEAGQTKPSIFKCKHCGAEGDHKSYECPVLICLTCGARDEHSTRSCPISKTCYHCGMKGHINKTCPNRYSRSIPAQGPHDDCDRCGLRGHMMNECPTLWRIYHYVNDEERILIKKSREESKQLPIGEGGEGHIASEEWCYNCANIGHLGDDCDELPRPWGAFEDPSAFSAYNTMSGPFYDPSTEPARIRRGPRDPQEDLSRLPDILDLNIPVDVGKRGRNKDREKLEKRHREQEDDDVVADWFASRNVKNRGMKEPSPLKKAMKFGSSFKDGGHHFLTSASSPSNSEKPRSLLDRLDGPFEPEQRRHSDCRRSRESGSLRIRGAADDRRNDNGRYSHKDRHQEKRREDKDRDRDRGGGRRSDRNHGPQYRGGYNR